MRLIAIVGVYGQVHKNALFDLLFTKGDPIGVRKYTSVETLLNDRKRPDLDLVVLMAGAVCSNLASLRATLQTPIVHLTIATSISVKISDHIAIVQLAFRNLERAREFRLDFARAADRWSTPTQSGLTTNWPPKLVPKEFIKSR